MCGGYILNALSDRLDDLYIVEPIGKTYECRTQKIKA